MFPLDYISLENIVLKNGEVKTQTLNGILILTSHVRSKLSVCKIYLLIAVEKFANTSRETF